MKRLSFRRQTHLNPALNFLINEIKPLRQHADPRIPAQRLQTVKTEQLEVRSRIQSERPRRRDERYHQIGPQNKD